MIPSHPNTARLNYNPNLPRPAQNVNKIPTFHLLFPSLPPDPSVLPLQLLTFVLPLSFPCPRTAHSLSPHPNRSALFLPLIYSFTHLPIYSPTFVKKWVKSRYKHSANIVQTTSLFIRIHPNFAEFHTFFLPILPNRYNRYAKISTYSNSSNAK